ncbi:hypothetical protein Halru_1816 [Halovivax ruber XH-70]|uniref:Uncharacterized protein n=1 Tax=Halovivax ruber (strain DSM 18193 / JCM 13892 / XH-70) TaxID=797302 RepID=L0IA06_HALRX|nr:hypothetical protein [Halovivax ruber]AGB16415.1 hypothetical protein Halru_1816 [Halovivax ruber XH-70]
MDAAARWDDLRTQLAALDDGAALETPVSARRFTTRSIEDDRLVIEFFDSGEDRTLRREQFDVLVDRLESNPIGIQTLQPGVEPYVTVLTLTSDIVIDGDDVVFNLAAETAGESPFLVSPAEARTAPDRLHDDALLLAEHLHRFDVSEPDELSTTDLTDCYVISSDVQRGSDRLRTTFRDELLDRLGPDQRLHGRFGTITRATRERRSLRDEATVFDALDAHDIPHEWVRGIDPTKVDVVLSVTDLEPDEVYDRSESVYVQKTGVDEDEKYELLAGIRDRLTELEGKEGDALRDELTDIESRIEAALAAG